MVEAGRSYLVQWSIPADEGARREKEKIKNAEPKDGPVVFGGNEERQTADNVHEKDADVEHPQIIRHLKKRESKHISSYYNLSRDVFAYRIPGVNCSAITS